MPNWCMPCELCGRTRPVQRLESVFLFAPGTADVIGWEFFCRDRRRCLRPWTRGDRLGQASFSDLFRRVLPRDPRVQAD